MTHSFRSLPRRPVPPMLFRRIQRVGRLLDEKGLIAATDGNLSVRDAEAGGVVITASGVHKGALEPADVIRTDLAGEVLWGVKGPSSESEMHLFLYRERPDVMAVVHAHPPVATAFAVSGRTLETRIMPESVLALGDVPLVPYATPGTPDLAQALEPYAHGHKAFLLANHGAVTVGATLEEAYDQMTRLEHAARIQLISQLMGGPRPLSEKDLDILLRAHGESTEWLRESSPPSVTERSQDEIESSDADMERRPERIADDSPELVQLIADAVFRQLSPGDGGVKRPETGGG